RRVADDAVPVRTKALGITEGEPENGRPPERHEALHHDGQHVLALDESAVKEGEPRSHQHDQARAKKHKSGVPDIDGDRCGSHRYPPFPNMGKIARATLAVPRYFPARTPSL